MKQPPVTIQDVAREAGVAISTVSRALNASAPTSPETRDRVSAVAARLGYRPSATARGLRRARTMTIGVVIPDLANPVFVQWVRGAEQALQPRGYTLLIADGQNSWPSMRSHLLRMYEQRVDGLLLGGVVPFDALQPFFEAGTPVEPDPRAHPRGQVPRASMEADATDSAYRCLVANGHRRIAFLTRRVAGRSRSVQPYHARVQRLNAILGEVNAQPAIRIDAGSETVAALRATVEQLSRTAFPPTAFIAGTHALAPLLLHAIYDAGLSIPGDLSFVTFGDSPWAEAHRPPISVIRHDFGREAAVFAARLLARLNDQRLDREPELPCSEFVARGSIAPPPG